MAEIDYSKVLENDFEMGFYKEIHKKIIEYLRENKKASFWKIVREVGGSDRRTLRLLNQMKLNREIELENKLIYLTGNKENSFSSSTKCARCKGKGILFNEEFFEILRKMNEICSNKPFPTFLFDQRPVTLETSVARAAYLDSCGDLAGKKIAVVGDDDLTSVALALTRKAEKIVVFDIDERLIDFIQDIAKKENLNINAFVCDLTKGVPEEFEGNFDVFLTDPTPQPETFSLFVSVGLNLLKEGSGNVGYVSFFPSHQSVSIDFQKVLTEKKVIITDMIPKFTEYEFIVETYRDEDLKILEEFDSGEERLSFNENLARFETTSETLKEIDKISKGSLSNMLGKATRRSLSNLEKDPAYIRGDKEFVIALAEKMKGSNNE